MVSRLVDRNVHTVEDITSDEMAFNSSLKGTKMVRGIVSRISYVCGFFLCKSVSHQME